MAKESYKSGRYVGVTWWAVFLLTGLLVLPVRAALHLPPSINLWYVFWYGLAISVLTVLFYGHDKNRAQKGGWRTPESTLHFLELLGGWPGALVAQRLFWHKVSKRSFLVRFWGIVMIYQVVSFDFLNDWHYSKALVEAVRQRAEGKRMGVQVLSSGNLYGTFTGVDREPSQSSDEAELDCLIFLNRKLDPLRLLQERQIVGLADALQLFSARYQELRKEAPEKFSCDDAKYWQGLHS